jgi:pyruvate dehydrogenase E2 component (dihydrolipoamide acetyltransferase)
MPINILMPALSPTMEKGNLAKWLKKEGDAIKSGDIIAEIETDKATMEVEAVDEGILAKILVAEGTVDVPVNQLIALIAGDGEDAKAVAAGGSAPAAPTTAAPQAVAPSQAGDQAATQATPSPVPSPSTTAAAEAGSPSPDIAKPAGKLESAQTGEGGGSSKIFSSPLARRIAREAGLDLGSIAGSGPHGRIVERDVLAAKAAGPVKAPAAQAAAPAPQIAAAAPPKLAPAPASMSDETIKKFFVPGTYEDVPHDNMRKTIAKRLTEAKATIPHFYLTVDCDLDALLKLREQINASAPGAKDGKPTFKVSVNDMVIKALAMALIRVPDANATFTEGSMLKHKHADVSVAVSIPGGLITPVIRSADTKTLSTIANEMKDFAQRAKDRKLKPEEYQGGTTAVSNLGMFGIKDFCAVINPPQSSILAVGAGEQRAIVKGGQVVVATIMSVTLSCDHRAIDGALGAQLISAFKQLIENPMGMLV